MNKQYDVVIIGGGPIGGYIAKKLAKQDVNVALLEEHNQPGLPLHCAGLVTSRTLEFLDTHSYEGILQNTITGACIHAPSGKTLTLGGTSTRAVVIDRQRFDTALITQAQKAGADLFLHTRCTNAYSSTDTVTTQAKHKNSPLTLESELLIGADGPRSTVRRLFNFRQPHELLHAMGAEVNNTQLEPHIVHIFVGSKIAPGFFAWIIPTNPQGSKARVGVCTSRRSPEKIKHYFSFLFTNKISGQYLRGSEIITYTAGVIPLGALRNTVDKRVLLVGDAAAQVKPTSGGGLYTGLCCAQHCSSVVSDYLNNKTHTLKHLKKYHSLWSSDIGKELQRGLRFRRLFTSLTDSQFNQYIEKFNKPKILKIINKYGDIDYPSKLLIPLIKSQPSLLWLLPYLSKKNKRYLREDGGGGT